MVCRSLRRGGRGGWLPVLAGREAAVGRGGTGWGNKTNGEPSKTIHEVRDENTLRGAVLARHQLPEAAETSPHLNSADAMD